MLSHSRCQLFTYIISIFTFKVSLQEGVIPHLQWRELRVREISWCVLWQADNWMSEQEGGALALHAAVCCAPCPGHRTGAVCLPSLPWCGFSAGCRSTRLNPTGRRQGLPEALSHNPLIPFICERGRFRHRVEGSCLHHFVDVLLYLSFWLIHWPHFCLPLPLHQGVLEKELSLALDQLCFERQFFLENALQLFSAPLPTLWNGLPVPL